MSDIFISYATEDRPRVQMFVQALEAQGWSIFWDRTIPIGKRWRDSIGKELNEAHCIVVLWSKVSIDSRWVQEEAEQGLGRGVLFPVLIDNVRPPLGFQSIQTADLADWDGTAPTQVFGRLIADIARVVVPVPKEAQQDRERIEAAAVVKAQQELPRNTTEAETKLKAETERKRGEAEAKRRRDQERKRRAVEAKYRADQERAETVHRAEQEAQQKRIEAEAQQKRIERSLIESLVLKKRAAAEGAPRAEGMLRRYIPNTGLDSWEDFRNWAIACVSGFLIVSFFWPHPLQWLYGKLLAVLGAN